MTEQALWFTDCELWSTSYAYFKTLYVPFLHFRYEQALSQDVIEASFCLGSAATETAWIANPCSCKKNKGKPCYTFFKEADIAACRLHFMGPTMELAILSKIEACIQTQRRNTDRQSGNNRDLSIVIKTIKFVTHYFAHAKDKFTYSYVPWFSRSYYYKSETITGTICVFREVNTMFIQGESALVK